MTHTISNHAAAGAKGGAAARGDSKRRNQQGLTQGRNSAGRSNSTRTGIAQRMDAYRDVYFACCDWIANRPVE